jgi:hypothetical protein
LFWHSYRQSPPPADESAYDWRDKSVGWTTVREYLTGENSSYFEQLRELDAVTDLIYIRSQSIP